MTEELVDAANVETPETVEKLDELKGLTNHERVVFLRAKKMGIPVEEYKKQFPKGSSNR